MDEGCQAPQPAAGFRQGRMFLLLAAWAFHLACLVSR